MTINSRDEKEDYIKYEANDYKSIYESLKDLAMKTFKDGRQDAIYISMSIEEYMRLFEDLGSRVNLIGSGIRLDFGPIKLFIHAVYSQE